MTGAAPHGPLGVAYRRLQRGYPLAVLVLQFQLAHVVVFFGVLELRLYQEMTTAQFWRVQGAAQLLILLDNLIATKIAWRALEPVQPWLEGARAPAATVGAWRALAALPGEYIRRHRLLPVLEIVAFCAFVTFELHLGADAFVAILLGGLVILMYGVTLRVLAMEIALRPMLQDVSGDLPPDAELGTAGVPLRVKLLAGLPMINVISGVTVAGLTGNHPDISQLGIAVIMAVLVAFTVSLWLTLLLARSILRPVGDLRAASDRVRAGDLEARVPVTATDETGEMAQSFNEMVVGLRERERLREAFGAFVDPEVARMVLDRGVDLAGEEVEVSVLFLDIRGFTAFAEGASARDVLRTLNEFYDVVVPVILRHGGHANKFQGDGLLAVFGAPERREDHADRAVACALALVDEVERRYRGEISIGVGVNSGPVAAGTVGGGGRVEFSVIGDAVNTAYRVEGLTRATGDPVLITDCTREQLRKSTEEWEPRPSLPLKGKSERVALWAPRSTAGGHDHRTFASGAHAPLG